MWEERPNTHRWALLIRSWDDLLTEQWWHRCLHVQVLFKCACLLNFCHDSYFLFLFLVMMMIKWINTWTLFIYISHIGKNTLYQILCPNVWHIKYGDFSAAWPSPQGARWPWAFLEVSPSTGALGVWLRCEGMELNLIYSNLVHMQWLAFFLDILCFLVSFLKKLLGFYQRCWQSIS